MIQKPLIGLFLCLATVASAQTYTFSCVCAQLSGDSCDVCPVTNIKARTFSGLIIYKNGDYFKWIDSPYTIRKLPGNNVQFLEQIPNPDNVTINLDYTQFFTVDGFIDSSEILIHNPARSEIEVSHFRITHLPRRQTHIFSRCLNQRQWIF